MLFSPINILVIEDNDGDFILLEAYLQSTRIDTSGIFHATSLRRGKELLEERVINLILLDLSLPDSVGLNSYDEIITRENNIPVIVLSGSKDEDMALAIVKRGAQDYLLKDDLSPGILEKTILYSIERKKNLIALQHSQIQYQFLFDNNPIPMWTFDLKTLKFTMVNNAAVIHYGYTREEFLSMSILDIRPDDEKQPLKDYVNERNTLANNNAGVWKHVKKNGEIILVEIASHLINDDQSHTKLVVAYDTTEKLKASAALEKSERIFRSVAESFPNGSISLLDQELSILYTNGSEYGKMGVDPAKYIGHKFLTNRNNTGQYEEIESSLNRSLGGETVMFELTQSGNAYSGVATPLGYADEFQEKIMVITQNITEKNRVEQHLKLLESVVINSVNGIVICNNPGNNKPYQIIFANKAQEEMTGYTIKELLGKSPKIFQGKNTDPKILHELKIALLSYTAFEADLLNYKKDGAPYWLHLSIIPVFNDKGACTHFIGLSKDISERKVAEEEIKNANRRLREKNRKIYEIAQINSHVIRKPVASILGLIGLLDKDKFTGTEIYEIIENLEISAKELDDVIHTIAKKAI